MSRAIKKIGDSEFEDGEVVDNEIGTKESDSKAGDSEIVARAAIPKRSPSPPPLPQELPEPPKVADPLGNASSERGVTFRVIETVEDGAVTAAEFAVSRLSDPEARR